MPWGGGTDVWIRDVDIKIEVKVLLMKLADSKKYHITIGKFDGDVELGNVPILKFV